MLNELKTNKLWRIVTLLTILAVLSASSVYATFVILDTEGLTVSITASAGSVKYSRDLATWNNTLSAQVGSAWYAEVKDFKADYTGTVTLNWTLKRGSTPVYTVIQTKSIVSGTLYDIIAEETATVPYNFGQKTAIIGNYTIRLIITGS